jgi:hypothetical protein
MNEKFKIEKLSELNSHLVRTKALSFARGEKIPESLFLMHEVVLLTLEAIGTITSISKCGCTTNDCGSLKAEEFLRQRIDFSAIKQESGEKNNA